MADDGLFAGMPLDIDPGLSAGVIELRSGESRLRAQLPDAARAKVEALWQRAKADPELAAELAEDVASLNESAPYVTHPGSMSKPEKCEVCGTPVTVVSEVPAAARAEPEPALWEPGQWRKHTPRRCRAMRGQA